MVPNTRVDQMNPSFTRRSGMVGWIIKDDGIVHGGSITAIYRLSP